MGRPKSYDRDEVLRRATNLFWDKGYEGTHLRELIAVTGISRFSLYKEFGGKEGLFREALDAYLEELAELGKLLRREPLGIRNIKDYVASFGEFGFRHGCFAVNTIHEKYVIPEPAYQVVRELVRGGEELFELNLRASVASGEISADVDTVGLAKVLTCMEIGILTYGILDPKYTDGDLALSALDQLLSCA